MSLIIPSGTRIYLTKKNPQTFYIRPDTILFNDTLYVAYDVKIDGQTIIPKGARVLGNWVAESLPIVGAQLQLTKIYICGCEYDICADSDIHITVSDFDLNEVNAATHIYKIADHNAQSKLNRRIVNYHCRVKVLMDSELNSVYIEILTKEIPVTLLEPFCGCY